MNLSLPTNTATNTHIRNGFVPSIAKKLNETSNAKAIKFYIIVLKLLMNYEDSTLFNRNFIYNQTISIHKKTHYTITGLFFVKTL